jgi:hypothetical protein
MEKIRIWDEHPGSATLILIIDFVNLEQDVDPRNQE